MNNIPDKKYIIPGIDWNGSPPLILPPDRLKIDLIDKELKIINRVEANQQEFDRKYKSNILSIIYNNDDDYVNSYLPAWRAWPDIMKEQYDKLNDKKTELINEKFKIWKKYLPKAEIYPPSENYESVLQPNNIPISQ